LSHREIPWFQLAKNLASHNQRQQQLLWDITSIPNSTISNTGTPEPLMAAATSRTADWENQHLQQYGGTNRTWTNSYLYAVCSIFN
jgi:hypothetical protein